MIKRTRTPRVSHKNMLAIGFLLALLATSVYTAEGDPTDAPADPPQQAKPKGEPQPDKSGKASADFTPSEEISEDFAVSFPVDI